MGFSQSVEVVPVNQFLLSFDKIKYVDTTDNVFYLVSINGQKPISGNFGFKNKPVFVYEYDSSFWGLLKKKGASDNTISIEKICFNFDTIAVMHKLLNCYGDKRIVARQVADFSESFVPGIWVNDSFITYTVEVEALFIINQLYFLEPFSYSPMPCLNLDSFSNLCTFRDIREIYNEYERFIKDIEVIGLEKMREENRMPIKKDCWCQNGTQALSQRKLMYMKSLQRE